MKIIVASACFLILLLTGLWYYLIAKHNELIVVDQPVGDFFTVSEAILVKPGLLFIVEGTQYRKPSQTIVTKPEYLSPGRHRAIRLPLITRQEEKKSLYFAVLYEDTDKNASLTQKDQVAKDVFGRELIMPFFIR